MKISSLSFILNEEFEIRKNIYIVSGRENTLIEKIKDIIVVRHRNDQYDIKNIKNINLYKREVGLFNQRSLYIIGSLSEINNDTLDILAKEEDSFLLAFENSASTTSKKNLFLKRDDCVLIDCYELNRDEKIKIIKDRINKRGIKLNEDIYWLLVERLDNKITFLDNELEKIFQLNQESINVDNISKILYLSSSGSEKIFFEIFNSYEKLTNLYRQKITNSNEFNNFYMTFKQYCFLIINNENEFEFLKNMPRYLFKEKQVFVSIFKKYNGVKKKKLIELMFDLEKNMRKYSIFDLSVGLRALISFKKVTFS